MTDQLEMLLRTRANCLTQQVDLMTHKAAYLSWLHDVGKDWRRRVRFWHWYIGIMLVLLVSDAIMVACTALQEAAASTFVPRLLLLGVAYGSLLIGHSGLKMAKGMCVRVRSWLEDALQPDWPMVKPGPIIERVVFKRAGDNETVH